MAELKPCPFCGSEVKLEKEWADVVSVVIIAECTVSKMNVCRKMLQLKHGTGGQTMSDLMPMGQLTYSIACYHCKNKAGGDAKKCRRCKCEIESGFEIDNSTFQTNEGDLISRSSLLEEIHNAGGCGAAKGSWDDGYDRGISVAYDIVESVTAVDAVEVVHGRWIHDDEYEDWAETMKHEHAANMIRDMVLRDGIKITVRPAYEHSETAIAIRVSRGMYNAERVLDLNHMDCTQMDREAFVCEVLRLLARDILMSRYDDLVERAHEKKERP